MKRTHAPSNVGRLSETPEEGIAAMAYPLLVKANLASAGADTGKSTSKEKQNTQTRPTVPRRSS